MLLILWVCQLFNAFILWLLFLLLDVLENLLGIIVNVDDIALVVTFKLLTIPLVMAD